MTDRETLLKRARAFEDMAADEDQRYYKIQSIRDSLREAELQEVENEARIRAMQELETSDPMFCTPRYFAASKGLFINKIIGEWYIDQQKPIESRTPEQVEA